MEKINEKKPKGYWQNYENCYNEAKKYKTIKEFNIKSSGAYASARKNGWFDDYIWIERKSKPNGYWQNYDNCKKEAERYKSRSEFAIKGPGAYNSALSNGWLDDFTWLTYPTIRQHKNSEFVIYAYEDCENKVVYVGLSKNIKRRHRDHINGISHKGKRDYDNLYKYYESIGKEMPLPRIKMTDLSPEDAQYYEDWYKKAYANNGWTPINKAKTGVGSSSLGLVDDKWTEDSCREEAKKYKTMTEFSLGAHSAYAKANKMGWTKDYTWFEQKEKPKKYWLDYNNCYNEALKYKTLTDFQNHCSKGYESARKNGWIEDYVWIERQCKHSGYWTKESCCEEARKYKTLIDFRKSSNSAYTIALRNGWDKEYVWLERQLKPSGYWNNYNLCFEKAKECSSRSDFERKYPIACRWARKNGWIDDYTWFSPSATGKKWNRETCYEEARKYKTKKAFLNGSPGAYDAVLKNKWMSDYDWFETIIKPNGYWNNYDLCREKAKECYNRTDFNRKYTVAYSWARKNGWLDDFFPKVA